MGSTQNPDERPYVASTIRGGNPGGACGRPTGHCSPGAGPPGGQASRSYGCTVVCSQMRWRSASSMKARCRCSSEKLRSMRARASSLQSSSRAMR